MMNPDETIKTIDIVIPIYNEDQIIALFYDRLRQELDKLPYRFTIYLLDDGSTDETYAMLKNIAEMDARVVLVQLSRNFGHQAALTAGLDLCSADAVITMDSDGQHPPELLGQMLELHENGYDIVLTQRSSSGQTSWLKKAGTSVFYWIINRIGDTKILPDAADFRLLSREVVEGIKKMREYHRILRGMVAWMGFRTAILPFTPKERLGGASKYTVKKMFRLAQDAIFSFSLIPLRIGITLGLLFLVLAAGEIIYVLSMWFRGRQDLLVPGWSSLMFVLLLLGGTLFIVLGIMGIYMGYIFQEVKGRPIYIIRSIKRQSPDHEDATN